MNIELKSTGFLIDEFIITRLKLNHFGEESLQKRQRRLSAAIIKRLSSCDEFHTLSILFSNLEQVNQDCWNAQETIMKTDLTDSTTIAKSAKEAQRLNAERNSIIRQIDTLLGESEYSPLKKSYG